MTGRRVIHDPMVSILADWFGFHQCDAKVLWELYKAPGALAEHELIRRSGSSASTIPSYCSRVRRALGNDAFPRSSRWSGRIYELTKSGRRQVAEAFENAAKELKPYLFDKSVEALEDEIFVLKEALGLTYKGDRKWGLTPQQAEILGVIAKVDTVATNSRICTAVWGTKLDAPEDEMAVIKVQITNMRPKLAKHGIVIKNKWGEGYYLTPESRAIVRAAA